MSEFSIFMPGQVWQYQTRAGEENSTLTVLQIDELENDTVIHIRVDGIRAGGPDHIGHLPFSADALEASVTAFIRHGGEIPDFEAGYNQWKQAFESGRAGYWQLTVREALDAITQMLRERSAS